TSQTESSLCSAMAASALQRLGAADDLHQLGGDRGLTRSVVLEREPVDHVGRVAGRGVHGRHAGAVLGGHGLEDRAEDLDLQVEREEGVEEALLARLVDELALIV